ncbi:GMP synthase subunit A [Methanofollis formosanus]|uniref:GMP synthase [glutamine-hydrolyzing] subunit A n=1 Tax=Methanofollis formosanus TaxID=299308 RepID=A0A8G1EHG2_9EURY|nr:GMP synthase subunit A [Methanofollis formosanus]QYZ79967.1 GMP synthase subunit A [Methanofollis formosanus]
MRPIFVVNNHGQFNHLIHRKLRDMDIEVAMVQNTTPPDEIAAGCRGIILGGGPSLERAGNCAGYLDLGLPVLGICLGLHIIATARGGAVGPGAHGGYGGVSVEITEESEILGGYPEQIHVWASHADEVKEVPAGFTVYAHSDICPVEAMGSAEDRIFGVQWHPEVSHTEDGDLLFRNFERICGE